MVLKLQRKMGAFVERVDRWQQSRPFAAFVYAVFRKYSEDEAGQRAGLLAYYGFLSLFPLLLVLATVLKLILNRNSELSHRILDTVVSYLPSVGHQLQQNITTIGGTGLALAIGIVLTLYGARGVADVMRGSLDHIWQVPYAERSRLPNSLLRSLAIIAIGGLGLAVPPVFFGYILAFAPDRLTAILSTALTAAVLYWVTVAVIKVGTSRPQPLKRIWLGALLAVIGLAMLQGIGGYIMARELTRLDALYGTFALVLGLVFWLYLQSQVLLLALEVDAVRFFHLSPRSLRAPLTPADQKAYRLYVSRARFHVPAHTEE